MKSLAFAASTSPSSFARKSRPRKRPRILLAEDDDDLRILLAMSFEASGYEVIEASSGFELMEELRGWDPDAEGAPTDLLITDVCMPGFDGIDLVEMLAATDRQVPTIVMSAVSDPDVCYRTSCLSGVTFLRKPLDFEDLEVRIRWMLTASRTSHW